MDRGSFLEEQLGELRPRLHGYCSRLLGSPLDGEDVVQDVLAQALLKPPAVSNREELGHWLFRVAHNRCLDLLRRRSVREKVDWNAILLSRGIRPPEDRAIARETVDRALKRILRLLPPKERAAILLKEVLDFSLKEIAEIIASTEGGVKAALHRARSKLAAARALGAEDLPDESERDAEQDRQLSDYAARFNSRDWTGLISLLRSDARLQVLEKYDGRGLEGFERHYFANYSRLRVDWRARLGHLGGEALVFFERPLDDGAETTWGLYSTVRVAFEGGQIASIRDYIHVPGYLIERICRELGGVVPAGFEDEHLPPPPS